MHDVVSRTCGTVLLFVALASATGCGGAAKSQVQGNEPSVAAAKAMELYDADKDDRLSAAELKNCPPLASAIKRIDTNGDGVIARDELQARFEALETQSDLVAVQIRVTSGRQPLADAVVTLTPEAFMGDGLQSYSGTTSATGDCYPTGESVELPGVPRGFYQVKIQQAAQGIDVTRANEISDDSSRNRLQIDL